MTTTAKIELTAEETAILNSLSTAYDSGRKAGVEYTRICVRFHQLGVPLNKRKADKEAGVEASGGMTEALIAMYNKQGLWPTKTTKKNGEQPMGYQAAIDYAKDKVQMAKELLGEHVEDDHFDMVKGGLQSALEQLRICNMVNAFINWKSKFSGLSEVGLPILKEKPEGKRKDAEPKGKQGEEKEGEEGNEPSEEELEAGEAVTAKEKELAQKIADLEQENEELAEELETTTAHVMDLTDKGQLGQALHQIFNLPKVQKSPELTAHATALLEGLGFSVELAEAV